MDCYKLKPETNFVWSISAGGRFGCVCTFHSDFFHDRCNCWVCTFHISVIHHEHLPSCQVPIIMLVCSSRLSHQLSRIEKTTSVQNSCCVRESLSPSHPAMQYCYLYYRKSSLHFIMQLQKEFPMQRGP